MEYAKREWFLSLLVILFVSLSFVDPSLPSRSIKLIDYESLAAIISFLTISRGLELSGIFIRISNRIVRFSGDSEFRLLCILVLVVFLSSAVIMNDTAMFVFVPLVLTISRIAEIDLPKAVTSIAIAANIGSALTPIGNPQNIIIWRSYGLSLIEFVRSMSSYVLLWFALLITFVWIGSRNKRLKISPMPAVRMNACLVFVSILLLILNVVLVEKGYSLVGLAVTLSALAVFSRNAILSLDIALIAVFALIFIDFKELSYLLSDIVRFEPSPTKVIILSAGLSQLISNVPATVMLTSQKFPWLPLAIGVNIGGTGLIIGSLANFIAVRISGIGIRKFHRYSLPYFLLALSLTLAMVSRSITMIHT